MPDAKISALPLLSGSLLESDVITVLRAGTNYRALANQQKITIGATDVAIGQAIDSILGPFTLGAYCEWNGEIIAGEYGGTGVANAGKTITLGGSLTLSGANDLTLTTGGATNVTLPTTGTLATLAGTETLSNKTLSGCTLTGNTTIPGSGQLSSAGLLGLGVTPGSWLDVGAALSSTPASTTAGVLGRFRSAIHTDPTGSGAIANRVGWSFGAPTFASTSSQTLASASTVYISGPPTAGANTTITSPAALVAGSGNVGIGTTTPDAPLNVVGGSTHNGIGGVAAIFASSNTSGPSVWIGSGGGTYDGREWSITAGASTNGILGSSPQNKFGVLDRTAGAARLIIDSTGNLGIGATNPQAMLHIGTTAATARIYNSFTDSSNGEWAYLGSWGSVANVATFGADKNGSGSYRASRWVSGGLEVWRARTNGDLQQGTGSALATNATGGFLLLASGAGAPTGTPANAAAGETALYYDTTNHKLWAYDQPAGAWKGVVVS